MSAFNSQVGGDHYKNLGMQPLMFATVNSYDPAAFAILKYMSRWRNKNGVQDLRKALHFVQLRVELLERIRLAENPVHDHISMRRYIKANSITGEDASILLALHEWVNTDIPHSLVFVRGNALEVDIQQLILKEEKANA